MFCIRRAMDQRGELLARLSVLEAEVAELRHGHLAPLGPLAPPAPPGPHPRSLFHGVTWFPRTRRWIVGIGPSKRGRRKYIGTFVNEEEAGRAYDVFAKERNYPVHKLNFPNE